MTTTNANFKVKNGLDVNGPTTIQNNQLLLKRSTTQYWLFENSDGTTAPYFKSFSAPNNAKQVVFDSRTDAAGTTPTAGTLGFSWQVQGTQALAIYQDLSAAFASTVSIGGTPTASNHAVTKSYIDTAITNVTNSITSTAGALSTHAADQTLHLTSAQNTWIDAITATSTEVNYLSGVTSNIQTQINNQVATSGDTMTGNLVGTSFRAAQGIPNNADLSTTGFAFGADGDTGLFSPIVGGGSPNGIASVFANNIEVTRWTQNGATMYKPLTLSADPTTALQAATKQYADTKIASTEKGVANGVATLGADSKVPAAQLPSYVDDVLEYANLAGFPATGETAKIYVALDTNKIYRWSGSAYIEISPTAGNSDTATKLATARTIAATGDASWSVSFDGSANVSSTLTLSTITDSGTGSFKKITTNTKGLVTGTATVTASDITTTLGILPVANGGTGSNIVLSAGAVAYSTATGLSLTAAGTAGQLLQSGGTATPSWISPSSLTVGNATTATTATYLSSTQQSNVIFGATTSMSMSQDSGATRGSFVCRASGTGDANLAGMTFWNDMYALKMGIRADGYFGIGGWSRPAWSWYTDPSGNMVAAGNVTAYSDPRLKEDVQPITNALDIVKQLNGVRFVWKDVPHVAVKAGNPDIGILATDVEAVLPELVSDSIQIDGESYKTVAYDKLVAVLIEAVKDLSAKVEELSKNNGVGESPTPAA